MAIYAIGDVQGCAAALNGLLEELRFEPGADQLWFTGDLVNRGPDSLQVLRFVRSLGPDAVTVLGNHDLHLLAHAAGQAPGHRKDTLRDILDAPDREALLAWLRQRPLLHHDPALGYTLIHAGLPPQWDLTLAQDCAAEVEACLRSDDHAAFLAHMYGNEPDYWDDSHTGWDRLRFITNCFTRLRYCDADGQLCLEAKGEPGTQPPGALPWFAVPGRRSRDLRILCGHWSALGLYRGEGVTALDTGCVWGGLLTAVRLHDGAVFSYACEPGQQIVAG
jgi:bis(5'-nucleosyl)-tetraphosphatase (symmetrical)